LSTEEKPIKINLIAPPVYVVTSSSLDRDEGVKLLQAVINKIKESIETQNGRFKVKMEPKVITDSDEADLQREMEKLDAENEEVSADEDEDEDGDEDGEEEEEEENDSKEVESSSKPLSATPVEASKSTKSKK
jgi:translation initiation factor 2 subunit 1